MLDRNTGDVSVAVWLSVWICLKVADTRQLMLWKCTFKSGLAQFQLLL